MDCILDQKKMDLEFNTIRKETLYMKVNIKIIKDKDGEEQLTMKVNLKKINAMDGVGIQLLMKCMKDIFKIISIMGME